MSPGGAGGAKRAGRQSFLVTGVAGFIGSNLALRLLDEGHRVVGVDNLSYGVIEQVPDRVEFHRGDIRDPSLYSLYDDIDVVFHLAAKNCIADCQQDPVETFDINVHGTAHVFEASRRASVRKIVYAESSALYEGITVFPTPEGETSPVSFYAESKAAGRAVAQGYARHSSLTITALRYFCVYGPRQDYRRTIPPVMSAFIIKLLKGEQPVIYGSGQKRRDFVYVDDVNDFHLRCASDPRTDGRTYNLGSGESYSVREIFDRIATLLGSGIEPRHEPDLPGEAEQTLADIRAARSLGWEPTIDLTTGLTRSIAYIREHVAGTTHHAPRATHEAPSHAR
jgi:UDP-glucose 4-epimerase